MLRLAVPVLAEQMLAMLVWFSDRLLAGHFLDKPHMAAITLMAYVLWLIYGTFSLVAIGATAMVARAVGAGEFKQARHVTNQAFVVGAVVAACVMLVGFLFGHRIVLALQLEGKAAELATSYLRYMLPVVPMIMAEAVGIACLRAAGDVVSGLIIMAVVNAVNVGVSCLLVIGPGPVPQLGWQGIAIGTVCGLVVGGVLFIALLIHGRYGLRLQLSRLRPNGALIRRLLQTGVPGGVDMLSMIGCQLWFVAVINQMGDGAAAAHGVAISIESMAFLPGVAFQTAASTLVGQYLGARNPRKAVRSALLACLIGGGVMMIVAAVLLLGADPLAGLFVRAEHADVAALAVPLLRIVALAMPALALTIILTGALRGAGDTRWPMAFSLVGLLGVRLPLAYWLGFESIRVPFTDHTFAGWGLGVCGAWYAMAADLALRAVLVSGRFAQGGWKRIKV